MPSNVETLRAAHECWNRRDFNGLLDKVADNIVYVDNARNQTFTGKQQYRGMLEYWASGWTDGQITQPEYIDAGDTVIAQFTAKGTNDKPFAGNPATNKPVSFRYCKIVTFDRNGKAVGGSCYYDQATLMVQLGISKITPSHSKAA